MSVSCRRTGPTLHASRVRRGGVRLDCLIAYRKPVVRLVDRDCDLPEAIIVCSALRGPDGTALSSRNVWPTAAAHATEPAVLDARNSELECLELRADEDLIPTDAVLRPSHLVCAAILKGVRLIHTLPVEPSCGNSPAATESVNV